MTKASKDEQYINLSEGKLNKLIDTLEEMEYTDEEMEFKVLPFLAQWLYSQGVAIESTCLIISEIINIEPIQEKIDSIYRGEFPPIAKSNLSNFLTDKEFTALETLIEPKDWKTIVGELDDTTEVVTNFKLKQVLQKKTKHYQNGNTQQTFSPIIEAVPTSVIVYDSPITEQGRTFRTTWCSKHSERKFSVVGENMGATIPEIADYIRNAGYSYNPKQLDITLSCMVNSLIDQGFAEIKTTIDNKGIYFDRGNEKLIPVKLEFTNITTDKIKECVELLDELVGYFKGNEDTFASVMKWSVMSIFSYAMKQAGNWLPYLYLKGSAGSGKTTLAQIGLYVYSIPTADNTMGGSSFNSEYRIGLNLSKECTPRIVNEPASVFTRDAPRELIKVCVESITCRKVQGRVYPAFAPVIFTANQYLPDDDALLRRMYVISFTHKQRKSEDEKKEFKNVFHVGTPTMSKLTSLEVLGRFAIQELLSDPSKLFDDWQQTADYIIKKFYEELDLTVPEWLESWAETETLDDFDNSQKEEIRNFFIGEFNNARRKITFKDENGYYVNPHLTTEEDGGLRDVCWGLVNERVFSWAIPHITRDKTENICLTQSFKTILGKEMGYSNNLKSLAELLGWDYHQVRFGKSNMKVIEVPFNEFINFVYPTTGGVVDEWY